mmetsp:Transcript_37419/g.69180  ORF Transcript_37419/g.69180 Transcript_37419/m.69180 type:complete len:241 (+) Transcript_37419:10263-10985(+)
MRVRAAGGISVAPVSIFSTTRSVTGQMMDPIGMTSASPDGQNAKGSKLPPPGFGALFSSLPSSSSSFCVFSAFSPSTFFSLPLEIFSSFSPDPVTASPPALPLSSLLSSLLTRSARSARSARSPSSSNHSIATLSSLPSPRATSARRRAIRKGAPSSSVWTETISPSPMRMPTSNIQASSTRRRPPLRLLTRRLGVDLPPFGSDLTPETTTVDPFVPDSDLPSSSSFFGRLGDRSSADPR